MPETVAVPTIVNVADLKPRKYRNVLLHCTEEQLGQAMKNAKKVDRAPKKGPAVEVLSLGPMGYLLSLPCEAGCTLDLVYKNGRFVRECVCPQVPHPPHIEKCRFAISTNPFRLGCEKEGCPSTCRLSVTPGPFIRFICTCG